MILQISAGQGPEECQRAVGGIYEALKEEYSDIMLLSARKGRPDGCYHSILFETSEDLSGLEGTMLWICKSPFRSGHKRKNWYVDVSVIPEAEEVDDTLDESAIAKQTNQAWAEHYKIVRGNPVRVYEGLEFKRKMVSQEKLLENCHTML